MSVQEPNGRRPVCPVCGAAAMSVTATRKPKAMRLCELDTAEARIPGEEWALYEPCGHEVDL